MEPTATAGDADGRLQLLALGCSRMSPDPRENILRLTALAKELLGSACAIYTAIPDDSEPIRGRPIAGRICFEPLDRPEDEVFTVLNLQQTDYARTDPMVRADGLETFMGKAVRLGASSVGCLCVAYDEPTEPTDADRSLLAILAGLIALEEQRRRAEDRIMRERVTTTRMFQAILDREERVLQLKREVNELHGELGRPGKYGAAVFARVQ